MQWMGSEDHFKQKPENYLQTYFLFSFRRSLFKIPHRLLIVAPVDVVVVAVVAVVEVSTPGFAVVALRRRGGF
jgi:hypothetical protein